MLDRISPRNRNIALAVLGALVVWFLWTVRSVLNPLILGYLLAYILHPAVLSLEKRGWKRRNAANTIFVGGFAMMTIVLGVVFVQAYGLGSSIANDNARIEDLEKDIEDGVNGSEFWLSVTPNWMLDDPVAAGDAKVLLPEELAREGKDKDGKPKQLDALDTVDRLNLKASLFLDEAEGWALKNFGDGDAGLEKAGKSLSLIQAWFGSAMALVMLLVLLPIYSYFLLFELDRIHSFVRRYIPKAERVRFSRVGRNIGEVISSFFRGRLTICFVKGLLITAGLAICGVDRSLLIGMTSGFMALIPFVGPLLGFAFAFVVALLQTNSGGAHFDEPLMALLATGIVYGIAEMLEGYVLVPKILGDSLGLHPVVVLAAVFVGGAALGMFGFLLALPLTAVVVILTKEYVLPALADFADEDKSAGADAPS